MPENNTTQPKCWRDAIKVHPAAGVFPMMREDELQVLSEDIRKNGLTSPIVFTPDRQLIDGRNRLEACERAGLKIVLGAMQPIDIVGLPNSGQISIVTDIDPLAYVVSANLHRRHLTPEQRRDLVASLLKAAPEKSNRETAKLAKVDHKTVGTIRDGLEATGEIPQLTKTTGADGKARPSRAAVRPKEAARGKPKSKPEGAAQTNPIIDPASLSLSAQEKLAAAIHQHKRQLDLEYDRRKAEIDKHINEVVIPTYQKGLDDFDRIIKAREGVMTAKVFKLIRSCLHPDRLAAIRSGPDPQAEARYAEAFRLFSELEVVLCNEMEKPTVRIILAREMRAARKADGAKRRAQREAGKAEATGN